MKVLLAYDGSRCAEAAIDDLYQAGLPPIGSAHIVSVAEVWLPPPDSLNQNGGSSEYVNEITRAHREKGEKAVVEASTHAKHAEARVRTALPGWAVTSHATYGSPAWEILSAAEEQRSDLIVVGSHGQSALSRFFLGSISQKVLTEANCSVRVARGKNQVEPAPARIVIGFDGSNGASAAVDAVASRHWHEGSKVRLIAATDAIAPSVVARMVPPVGRMVEDVNIAEEHWLEQLADAAVAKLRDKGIDAGLHLHAGNPKDLLVKEAERWSADCIFVGASAHVGLLQRALLGSTSAAVAARAHCSVEVVRVARIASLTTNGKKHDG